MDAAILFMLLVGAVIVSLFALALWAAYLNRLEDRAWRRTKRAMIEEVEAVRRGYDQVCERLDDLPIPQERSTLEELVDRTEDTKIQIWRDYLEALVRQENGEVFTFTGFDGLINPATGKEAEDE